MKQAIFDAAIHLMQVNGQTTTLEVKNYLHSVNDQTPNFELGQKEVSKFMRELCDEHNWEKNPSTQGYIIYSTSIISQQTKVLALGNSTPNSHSTSITAIVNSHIAYVRNDPKLHAIGVTRKDARTKAYQLYKTEAGDYNNINTCLSNYYFKIKMK